jgi:hypothetical protein
MTSIKKTMNTQIHNKKIVSFGVDAKSIQEVQSEITQNGWHIVHLINKGKEFIGILEKNFIRHDESNNPIVFVPARKNFKWIS